MPSINRLVLRVAGLACDIFYRRSRLGGEVPATGPVLLVANHPNGLVDPVLLALTTGRPVRFLGKAPLFELPVLGGILRGMRALPVYRAKDGADTADNERTFEAVFAALRGGDVVALFPEGHSHSEPRLDRLKTGAARMALGAEASAEFALGVRIVPVGLHFRRKRRFRSRVACWVGDPIDTGAFRVEHDQDDREAVRSLTARIAEGLHGVTLNLDRWEELPLLELAERIWRPGEGRRVERMRGLAEAVAELRATRPDALRELASDVAAFAERLRRLGVSPDDLAVSYTPALVLSFVARTLFALVLGLPLAFLGSALWWLPYRLSPVLARLGGPTPETLVTHIVLAGLVLFPAWYFLLIGAAALAAGAGWALAAAVLGPLLGAFALAYRDRWEQARGDLAVFFRLGRRSGLKARLLQQRDALAERIEELSRTLGANANFS
ncbi:MAG: 1-acyl-sn-glycerol-3-phosphate acyltransferase [Planctomycetota bacterium]